jgi:hypothetical protein
MIRFRVSIAAFGLTALGLIAAASAAASLPSACGEVGRPNVQAAAEASLVFASLAWLVGVGTGARYLSSKGDSRSRVAVAALALLGLGLGVAIFLYYRHQIAWEGHCG